MKQATRHLTTGTAHVVVDGIVPGWSRTGALGLALRSSLELARPRVWTLESVEIFFEIPLKVHTWWIRDANADRVDDRGNLVINCRCDLFLRHACPDYSNKQSACSTTVETFEQIDGGRCPTTRPDRMNHIHGACLAGLWLSLVPLTLSVQRQRP